MTHEYCILVIQWYDVHKIEHGHKSNECKPSNPILMSLYLYTYHTVILETTISITYW